MGCSLIYTTVKNSGEAKKLGKILIKEKLIACVNFFPVHTIYPWKGKIEGGQEVGVLVKTRMLLVRKALKRIKELHSYEVPCVVSLSVWRGNRNFFKWIRKTTKNAIQNK